MRVAPAAFSLIPNMSSSPFLHRLVPSPRSRPFVSYSTNECVSSIISSTSVSSIVSPLFIHFTTTSYPSLSSHSHHCHCQSFRLLAFSSLMLLPLRTSIPTPRIRETELDKTAHPHHHPPRLPPPPPAPMTIRKKNRTNKTRRRTKRDTKQTNRHEPSIMTTSKTQRQKKTKDTGAPPRREVITKHSQDKKTRRPDETHTETE